MITRVQLQNWQCYKKLDIKFSEVTALVGPSDAGKSAIFRALQWVATNQPGGTAFIRDGAKGCTVRVWVDGHVVTRKRSRTATVNTYQLDDGPTLKAFGRGVPADVAALFNVSATNWQGQHDAPFWLSLTAGQVGQQLNALVDLDVLDATLAEAGRGVRQTRQTEAAKAEAAKQLTAEHKELTQAHDGMHRAARTATLAAQDLGRAVSSATRLQKLSADACGATDQVTAYAAATKMAKAAAKLVKNAQTAKKRVARLAALANDVRATRDKVQPLPVAAVRAATKLQADATAKAVAVADIQKLIDQAAQETNLICTTNSKLKQTRAKLPSVCPTCGQTV